MRRPLNFLSVRDLARVTESTIAHYNESTHAFWKGTKDHDVSQNIEAFLSHIEGTPPFTVLDLGCGPGRDLLTFRAAGHRATGLDGAENFVTMARQRSGCEVLHQNLLQLELEPESFDGIYANATLFHVPTQELSRVLQALHSALKPRGVLFASNPRGPDIEGAQNDDRYGAYLRLETWDGYLEAAGFEQLEHFYRPAGRPLVQQPWLATVYRRSAAKK